MRFRGVVALAAMLLAVGVARAQAGDDMLSQKEVESLRDAAYVPTDRVLAYEKILNDREKMIDDLMKKPHHVTFGPDMHDLMDQFGAIAG